MPPLSQNHSCNGVRRDFLSTDGMFSARNLSFASLLSLKCLSECTQQTVGLGVPAALSSTHLVSVGLPPWHDRIRVLPEYTPLEAAVDLCAGLALTCNKSTGLSTVVTPSPTPF